jgi:hypothetical protein
MAMRVSYRLETPFSPTECCELLRRASKNQTTVHMAPNWIHAPHIVRGKIGTEGIQIYHAGQIEDPDKIYLFADIFTTGAGSAIVGEFRRGKFQLFWITLARLTITILLVGFPACMAYGVWKDENASFTPSLIVVIVLPLVVWLLSLYPLRKWVEISPNDTQIVRKFIERATQTQNIEQAAQDHPLPAAQFG